MGESVSKSIMKVKSFYEPVFEATVLFITDSTPAEIETYLKKKKNTTVIDGFDSTAGSVTFLDETDKQGRKTREYMVIVEDKKGFYTLLHETHHLATHIMHDRMIEIRQENDEVAAYIQNYWFRTLWRFMTDKKVTYKHI